MIDKKELKIWNVVISDSKKGSKWHYISSLRSNKCVLDHSYSCKYDELKPYNITEKTLINLGFKKEVDKDLENTIDFNTTMGKYTIMVSTGWYASHTVDRNYSIRILNDACETIFFAEMQYLHQLQNAIFFATGIEIYINSFDL